MAGCGAAIFVRIDEARMAGTRPAMTGSREADFPHMHASLALGRRGLGTTWPNPSVGCVIVRDGRVVGRGNTAAGRAPARRTGCPSDGG